ncbi:MAG: hypothetical protein ACFFDI_06180 [Promethearchaeota archaeon]
MEITLKKLLTPIIVGVLIWIVAFFVIGWTQISEDPFVQSLYLPMVLLFGVITLIFIIIFFYWYLPSLNIDLQAEWLLESVLFGIVVMAVQYILDLISFTIFFPIDLVVYFFGLFMGNPDGSTVMIMYPLIVVWSVLGGVITRKLRA